MAQTSRCSLHGGSYKPPLGVCLHVCAIYSQSTLCGPGFDDLLRWIYDSRPVGEDPLLDVGQLDRLDRLLSQGELQLLSHPIPIL